MALYGKGAHPGPPENELDPQTHLWVARSGRELWKTVERPWEAQAFLLRVECAGMPLAARIPGAFPDVLLVPPRLPVDCHSPGSCARRSLRSSYFQSERAPHHFSISDRRFLHRALVLQWLLTSQSLMRPRVQLIIGKTGEVLSLTQAVHLAIFTLSELNQLSLCSFPRTEEISTF